MFSTDMQKQIRHVNPQNRFTLKEFETTTQEIGLMIFWINNFPKSLEQFRRILYFFSMLTRDFP